MWMSFTNMLTFFSDVRVSRYVIRRHKYDYVDSLVEYHQMESRRSIRLLLVEVFMQVTPWSDGIHD